VGAFLLPAAKEESFVDTFYTYMIIAFAGAIGTAARYGISVAMLPWSRVLPCGTILINISGSLLIGFFGTLTLAGGKYPVSENMRLFVMIGLCGGFTTFSSFSLQTLDLLRSGAVMRASLNVILSVILCVGAVAVGHAIAAHYNGGATAIAQIEIEEEA
jgi:CrcB protein